LGRRGRKRQLAVEDEYWKLVLEGVGTVEACRQVGIGRKTGYRWRAERGGLPPLRLGEADRTGRYLSQLERQRIATLRDRGVGVREIARRLGRSPSTVSRELRRNLRPHDGGVYDGDLAHARARNGPAGTVLAASLSTTTYARSSRTGSSWSGAPSRSPPGCG
jgi:transposase-like protein